jgi:hypothetical protein
MLGDVPFKELTLLKPDWCTRVGRPKLRWMDEAEDDLKKLSVRGWRRRGNGKIYWKQPGPKLGYRAINKR